MERPRGRRHVACEFDRVLQTARGFPAYPPCTADAFEGDEQAAWHAVKMRRFYFTQAAVLDGCRRAAKTIDEILVENA